jgi:hypothetical protein
VVEVLEGVGLGEAVVALSASHDSLPPDAAAVAAAVSAVAASTPPEATVTSTLPAARVIAVRRAGAKRILSSRPVIRRVDTVRPSVGI